MNIEFAIGLHIAGFIASRDGQAVTSVAMANSFGTSPVVLRRVLVKLNKAGLVITKRGSGGGSMLARDAKNITLREVYDAVCKTPEIFRRHPAGDAAVSKVLGAYINEFYHRAEASMFEQLESVSVADMDATVRPLILKALDCE